MLPYYTPETQTQITTYYNDSVYAAMKEGGKWPESKLDSPVNINITEEVWETWYYKSGDLGIDLTEESWFHFPGGILVFLAKSKTTPETFFKDLTPWTDTSIDTLCPDLTGLYNEIDNSNRSYLVLESGNYVEGIFSRREFGTGETLHYVKFLVDLKTSSIYDDELQVKFFDTLSAALADQMTEDVVIYVKDDAKSSPQ